MSQSKELKALAINPAKAMNVIADSGIIITTATGWCGLIIAAIEKGDLEEATKRLEDMQKGMPRSFANSCERNAYTEEELPEKERFALEQAKAEAQADGMPASKLRVYSDRDLDPSSGYKH